MVLSTEKEQIALLFTGFPQRLASYYNVESTQSGIFGALEVVYIEADVAFVFVRVNHHPDPAPRPYFQFEAYLVPNCGCWLLQFKVPAQTSAIITNGEFKVHAHALRCCWCCSN